MGSGEFQGIWGGLRVYYGQHDKTLMQRHRQDDPTAWDTLFSILNSYNSNSSSNQVCTDSFLDMLSGGSCVESGYPVD